MQTPIAKAFAQFVTALALVATPCLAQSSAIKDDTARMDALVKSQVDSKAFMGTVLVARGDQIVFDKAYGYANLEWMTPNTPETKFRIGSVTKQFTAASILLLEERGKLKLDVPIKTYLPDAPSSWDKVTIFHLLNHTSGIPSFTGFPDYPELQSKAQTTAQLVARFKDKPLEFQPGEKWNYSNSGYALLGYVIEKISGQTYADFVQKNLFDPLDMKDSGYDAHAPIIAHRASGYVPTSQGLMNAPYIDMSIPHGAGALYSTTHDLLKWEQGLFGGKLLKPASLKKMTTPYKESYGFGLNIKTLKDRTEIAHSGGIDGFNARLVYLPDDKMTVVVLANINGSAPDQIADQLIALTHGQSITLRKERKAITLKAETMAPYVGAYTLAPGFVITVSLEGDHLMAQATGQQKFELFPESESRFFLLAVDAQIEFFKGPDSKISHLVLYQGGKEIKGVRQ